MPRQFIKDQLEDILVNKNVAVLFAPDELAYLTLQQKNERQIRDKVAWVLQQRLDKKFGIGAFMARCEWPNDVDSKNLDYSKARPLKHSDPKEAKELKGRSAVDLAILKMNTNRDDYEEVIALIEFKSHLFLTRETWAQEQFNKDVEKMVAISELDRNGKQPDYRIKDADLYYIYIMNSHVTAGKTNRYASAVGYKNQLDMHKRSNAAKAPQKLFDENDYQQALTNEFDSIKNTVIILNKPNVYCQPLQSHQIGTSFEHPLYYTCMLWGPYNGRDINI